MTDELHEDIKQILQKTTRIETALWPDPGQPGILKQHSDRMDEIDDKIGNLESWRNRLAGAWAVVATFFGVHLSRGNH